MSIPNGTETDLMNATNSTSLEYGRDSLYIIIPMTVFYIIILITGLVGNVSTCIVIFYNRYMHTTTNYYLFSLAVSDLVLLLSALPKEVYELWFRSSYVFGELCCFLQGFASETAANATVLTITAFTVERYVAICHPFISHTISKLSRAVKQIIIIWLMALFLAVPQAMQSGIITNGVDQFECSVLPSAMDHTFEISSLLFFVIPMCVISVLYILIGLRLRNSQMLKQYSHGTECHLERSFNKNQTKVIRMLIAVVVAFIICWAPFHAQRLVAIYGLRTTNPSDFVLTLYIVLTYTSGILYYLSATINPILYNIMSYRFRRAFKLTFGHLCRCFLPKHKRSRYVMRSRSTARTHHFQHSTPHSSLLRKEEIQLTRQHRASLTERKLSTSTLRSQSSNSEMMKTPCLSSTSTEMDNHTAQSNPPGEHKRSSPQKFRSCVNGWILEKLHLINGNVILVYF